MIDHNVFLFLPQSKVWTVCSRLGWPPWEIKCDNYLSLIWLLPVISFKTVNLLKHLGRTKRRQEGFPEDAKWAKCRKCFMHLEWHMRELYASKRANINKRMFQWIPRPIQKASRLVKLIANRSITWLTQPSTPQILGPAFQLGRCPFWYIPCCRRHWTYDTCSISISI